MSDIGSFHHLLKIYGITRLNSDIICLSDIRLCNKRGVSNCEAPIWALCQCFKLFATQQNLKRIDDISLIISVHFCAVYLKSKELKKLQPPPLPLKNGKVKNCSLPATEIGKPSSLVYTQIGNLFHQKCWNRSKTEKISCKTNSKKCRDWDNN